MATDASYPVVQKITVTLPKALLVRLDEYVAPRQRSRFIVEAIELRMALRHHSWGKKRTLLSF